MTPHKLIFTMQLKPATELLDGNLQLIYPDGKAIDYLATSGCAGWQQPGDEWERGKGPIPQGFDYEIPTRPYWSDTRGIEGLFFHITPDPVVSPGGRTRSELGIHFDANVPGSAGCIVLRNRSGWEKFCQRMEAMARSGIKQIPLKVVYA
ncbi:MULTISPECIES: hypothetical protein [unclassified Microcoleus]|uniref:hypothetical protein n=1 Tax=unclassified Microcoleus TaxID=2642155 RepID=UPI001D3F5F57|nr:MULTISPECIES: hypothetical protein [unclassified Microcoleus]MCC3568304.1 hypothetical protein [Microcoleus sp. PH2017_31_RDM_U_A]MCC3580557.1 hypothetical protein [Microcoleus sp. PH2017_32_RDM_D_A]MCC3618688.1 hypothetical protein [Microcoleus sp. PH2017_38_RDM_U_B]